MNDCCCYCFVICLPCWCDVVASGKLPHWQLDASCGCFCGISYVYNIRCFLLLTLTSLAHYTTAAVLPKKAQLAVVTNLAPSLLLFKLGSRKIPGKPRDRFRAKRVLYIYLHVCMYAATPKQGGRRKGGGGEKVWCCFAVKRAFVNLFFRLSPPPPPSACPSVHCLPVSCLSVVSKGWLVWCCCTNPSLRSDVCVCCCASLSVCAKCVMSVWRNIINMLHHLSITGRRLYYVTRMWTDEQMLLLLLASTTATAVA